MRKHYLILLLVIILGAVQLDCAYIIDHDLYLEVLIEEGRNLNAKTSGKIHVSEDKSPISKTFEGSIKLMLQDNTTLKYFGVLNRSETIADSVSDGQDLHLKTNFAWKDGRLKLEKERLIYEDISFPSMDEAQRYCQETGIPQKNITPVEMIGTQLRIADSSGKSSYFELPVRLKSEQDIVFGTSKYGYGGSFIIKAVGGKLVVCHVLPMDEYIAGVIQNEIGSNAPLEAMKTQAVTARSHAVSLLLYNRHKYDGYDLCNSTHCQVYKGKHLLNQNVLDAVSSTKNQVLVHEERIASTTYHSSSGGKTDSSMNIWKGKPYPYLMGVVVYPEAEEYDLTQEADCRAWIDFKLDSSNMSNWERASLSWTRSISNSQLASNLGIARVDSIEIIKRGFSGRILSIRINGSTVLDGEYKIRQAFGALPSSLFYIEGSSSTNAAGNTVYRIGSNVKVVGKGSGHGVGMCQVSTLQRARTGQIYNEILEFFYPGTQIISNWLETNE